MAVGYVMVCKVFKLDFAQATVVIDDLGPDDVDGEGTVQEAWCC